jgi:hypothetical protein
MKTKRTLLMAFPILSCLACGKSDAEKFADTFCGEVSKCCRERGMSGDSQICKMFLSTAQGYNASAGEACLAEVKAQAAAGTFCQSTSSDSSPCKSVYSSGSGKGKPGEVCSTDSDCAKSSEGQVTCASILVNDDWKRMCQVWIAGKAGDACVGTQDGDGYGGSGDNTLPRITMCKISDGLRCAEGSCVPLSAVGASCSWTSDCVRSAYCDSTRNKCAARIANGGTCAVSYNNDCVAGSYCNPDSKQCTAQLAIGATCSSDDMCLSVNCSDNVCTDFGADLGLGLLCGGS